MSAVLAIDIGTKCGFACGDPSTNNERVVSGCWNLKPNRFQDHGTRFVLLYNALTELHKSTGFTLIVVEAVRRHLGTDAAHMYGGYLAIIQKWATDNHVAYNGVPVATIKKYATGKGNADKKMMIAAVRGWGYEIQDENEADALALLHYVWEECPEGIVLESRVMG